MVQSILLVHGSFHNAECWDHLAPHLEECGLEVHAITLGGHRGNPRPAAEVNMQTYGQDVIDCAMRLSAPPLLIGHSMGGLVISQAAERQPDLFSAMIYLAAFVPTPGRVSAMDLAPISEGMMVALAGELRTNPSEVVSFPKDAARDVFYNGCSPNLQDEALARLSPQPLAASVDSVETSRARLGSVRKHYIECLRDQALPLTSQRTMQANADFDSIRALDSDHSPFFSMPGELADAIAKIALESAK